MNTIGSNKEKLKHLCLIGMSGVGKSYWSLLLKQEGYQRFSCDEYIFQQLQKKLPQNDDFMEALSSWLGKPEDPYYAQHAQEYLECENQSLLAAAEFYKSNELAVIDSSGSLVLCEESLINDLRLYGPLVYLESDSSFYQRITDNFIEHPKPVIWSEDYDQNLSARENFSNLINYRASLYKKYANKTINSNEFQQAKTSEDFLLLICDGQAN